jgi:hypothetical protein
MLNQKPTPRTPSTRYQQILMPQNRLFGGEADTLVIQIISKYIDISQN